MTVYVDHLRPVAKTSRWPYRWTAHMVADSVEELHEFAAKIGMHREWFQAGSTPHYDVTSTTHAKALNLGAKLIDRTDLVALIRKLRDERKAADP